MGHLRREKTEGETIIPWLLAGAILVGLIWVSFGPGDSDNGTHPQSSEGKINVSSNNSASPGDAEESKERCVFYKGQKVTFASGGPAMTVVSAHNDSNGPGRNRERCHYKVGWFTKVGEYESRRFRQSSLKKVK